MHFRTSPCSLGNPKKEHLRVVHPTQRPGSRPSHRRRREDIGRADHPDTAKEKQQEGEIVAVGAGAKDEDGARIAMDVKAGDRILFGKWSGTEIKLDGEDLMIIKESDTLGVMA